MLPYLLICKKCKRLLILAERENIEDDGGTIKCEFNTDGNKYSEHLKRCFMGLDRPVTERNTIRIDLF